MEIRATYNLKDWHSEVDDAVASAVKEMQQEMDYTILASLLVESGWVEAELSATALNTTVQEAATWTATNMQNKFKNHGRRFVFKHEHDAMWFKLRWPV